MQFFPAAVEAFPDLSGKDSLILLGRAPSPARAVKLTRSQLVSALRSARRHQCGGQGRRFAHLVAPKQLAAAVDHSGGIRGIVSSQIVLISALYTQALDALVDPVTWGDPVSALRWTTKSTAKLAGELAASGCQASASTVAYSLHPATRPNTPT